MSHTIKLIILWCLIQPFALYGVEFNKSLNLPHYYCTPSDAKHFHLVKNLIGSIHKADFEHLGEIAVFDLGLTPEQVHELSHMQRVKVYTVEMTHPQLLTYFITHQNGRPVRGWFAWKPVIMKQALEIYPYVLYLDAGSTVLRPLDDLFEYINERGYFLMNNFQSPLCNIVNRITKKVLDTLVCPLDQSMQDFLLAEDTMELDAGMQGVSRAMLSTYIEPLYEHSKDLSLFEDDGSAPYGYGEGRHDQILFSIYALCQHLTIHNEGWINLPIHSRAVRIHIHWHPAQITSDTVIYRSRHDIHFQGGKTQYIRYI